jgi:ribosome-binding protein aMBF1 (putative translation factor)
MLNHSPPNYKISRLLIITLRLFLHPDRTLGERVKKWSLEQGLFQMDLAKMIGVNEMTIINWEKGRTTPTKKNLGRVKATLGFESPTR